MKLGDARVATHQHFNVRLGADCGQRLGIEIRGYLAQIGSIELECKDLSIVDDNPFFCPDPSRVPELEAYMDALRKSGDSVGARVNVVARNVPAGLGAPVYGKLDAELASAMMSINAAKAVEIGAGFASVEQHGSEHRDPITPEGFLSNNAGGVLGGDGRARDGRRRRGGGDIDGQRMTLRSVPQLHFNRDYSIERGARLSSLIDSAVRGDHADNGDSEPDS